MGKREISTKTWLEYEKLRDSGWSRSAAANKVDISYNSAKNYDKGLIKTIEANRVVEVNKIIDTSSGTIPPKSIDDLDEVAYEALYDFDLFRLHYLGRKNKPWQTHAAKMVVEKEETEEREWMVINVPPGSGKSTTFTHDIPIWLIVRGRVLGKDVRIMIGSRTQRQANQYGRRLRATLERSRPVENAEGTLSVDYGEFKPKDNNLWRSEEFIVWENAEEQPTDEKEPTVMCAGMDTGFLGGRFRFVIWDDLVDASTIRTEHARDKQQQWYDDEAETRLEPGGLFILQGQRLSPDDLYRYALDKPGVNEKGDPTGDSKYEHVVYPAHAEELCEELHEKTDPPWPEGCLLDPERLGWRDLMTVKNNNPRRFDIIMQQKDVDPAGSLIPRAFIEGGNWHGVELPGCLDYERSLMMAPPGANGDWISAISVDPSPTKFWSLQWWLYDPNTEYRYLMNLHRQAMDAPDFLDRLRNGAYVGLLDDMVRQAGEIGFAVESVIVEQNAAQRFLLQYEYVKDWQMQRGVNIIPHNTTASNKASEEYGVQTLRPHYQFGRVRLPYGDVHSRSVVADLVDELVVWPNGRTDDCVMAEWMFEWNLPNLTSSRIPIPVRSGIPSWMKKRFEN